jgi:hypothetical protein
MSDYLEFRGRCKELSEAAVRSDPSLTLVRGYYHCPMWGKQAHWWCVRADGSIVDPTKDQFPSRGIGHYELFDGVLHCAECQKEVSEKSAIFESRYPFCSYQCAGRFASASWSSL